MSNSLFIADQRMLKLMEYAVKNGIAATEQEYWKAIEFPRTNITNVRNGKQGFTKDHILNACRVTGANANWLFGLEKNMFREKNGKSPIQLLKEAVATVEDQLK